MECKEEIEVLLEGLDETDISSILSKWKEIVEIRKQLDVFEEMLRDKVKAYLKEREWNDYNDELTKISVHLSVQKKETIDKEQLKLLITDAQYVSILKTTTFEKLMIVTSEMRQKMKKMIK